MNILASHGRQAVDKCSVGRNNNMALEQHNLDPSAAEFGRRRQKKTLSRKSAEKNSASHPPPKTRKFGGRRICDRLIKIIYRLLVKYSLLLSNIRLLLVHAGVFCNCVSAAEWKSCLSKPISSIHPPLVYRVH